MPFTPLHFGLHGLVGLIFFRYLCLPTFLLSNVVIDIQPLLVLLGVINTPLHGISHTFLGSTVLGTVLGLISVPLLPFYKSQFEKLSFPYNPSGLSVIVSAVLGSWFHVITDMPIYDDMHPFYPSDYNPVYMSLTYHFVANICIMSGIVALVLFLWIRQKYMNRRG